METGFFLDLDRRDLVEPDLQKRAKILDRSYQLFDAPEYGKEQNGIESGGVVNFSWNPLVLDNGNYKIQISYRGGRIEQDLHIKRIGVNTIVATRVKDVDSDKILLECKDADFPSSKEWKSNLPKCTPNFPAKE